MKSHVPYKDINLFKYYIFGGVAEATYEFDREKSDSKSTPLSAKQWET